MLESYRASRQAMFEGAPARTARVEARAIVKRLLHKNVKVKKGAHGLGLFATGAIEKFYSIDAGTSVFGTPMLRFLCWPCKLRRWAP